MGGETNARLSFDGESGKVVIVGRPIVTLQRREGDVGRRHPHHRLPTALPSKKRKTITTPPT